MQRGAHCSRSPSLLQPRLSMQLSAVILLLSLLPLVVLNCVPAFASSPLQLCRLQLLRPSSLLLFPPFSPSVLSYSLSSPTLLSSLTLSASVCGGVSPTLQLRLNDGPLLQLDSASAAEEEVELLDGVNHLLLLLQDDDAQQHDAPLPVLLTVCNGLDCHTEDEADTASAQLAALLPAASSVRLSPAFAASVFSYSAAVSRHVHGLSLSPSLLQPNGQLVVASLNGEAFTAVPSAGRALSSPRAMPLRRGRNVLFVQVRDAQHQLCTYTLLMQRSMDSASSGGSQAGAEDSIQYIGGLAYVRVHEASTELSSLLCSAGLLSPRFQQELRQYRLTVDFHTASLTVTATPKDSEAQLRLLYSSSLSAAPAPVSLPLQKDRQSADISLGVGLTRIMLQVTSYDGEKRDSYTILVSRLSEEDEADGTAELRPAALPLSAAAPASAASPRAAALQRAAPHRSRLVSTQLNQATLQGVRGQQYSVSVESGSVYSLLTEPHLLVNARFVHAASLLPNTARARARAEAGSMAIAEVGILTRSGHVLHLETGLGAQEADDEAELEFGRVALNEQLMNVGDQAEIDNRVESRHEQEAGESEGEQAALSFSSHSELLVYNSSRCFTLVTPQWRITLRDSPTAGIVPTVELRRPLPFDAHGLIAQTWRDKREGLQRLHGSAADRQRQSSARLGSSSADGSEGGLELLEGSMLDYRVRDGQLFSHDFPFNLFESEGAH